MTELAAELIKYHYSLDVIFFFLRLTSSFIVTDNYFGLFFTVYKEQDFIITLKVFQIIIASKLE